MGRKSKAEGFNPVKKELELDKILPKSCLKSLKKTNRLLNLLQNKNKTFSSVRDDER